MLFKQSNLTFQIELAWGTLIGQLTFGYMADKIGRKDLYALVLILITLGTLARYGKVCTQCDQSINVYTFDGYITSL